MRCIRLRSSIVKVKIFIDRIIVLKYRVLRLLHMLRTVSYGESSATIHDPLHGYCDNRTVGDLSSEKRVSSVTASGDFDNALFGNVVE